jgi:hypothetical protein
MELLAYLWRVSPNLPGLVFGAGAWFCAFLSIALIGTVLAERPARFKSGEILVGVILLTLAVVSFLPVWNWHGPGGHGHIFWYPDHVH